MVPGLGRGSTLPRTKHPQRSGGLRRGSASSAEITRQRLPAAREGAVTAGKTPYVRFDLNDYSVPRTHVRRQQQKFIQSGHWRQSLFVAEYRRIGGNGRGRIVGWTGLPFQLRRRNPSEEKLHRSCSTCGE